MTLAYLTPEYPHPRIGASGGLGTSIKNLAEALAADGHRIIVIVSGQARDEVFDEDEIRYYRIKHRRIPLITWFTYRKYLNRRINTIIAQERIQIVEAPDWTGLTAFMRFKVPLVIRFHGSDTYFCHLEKRPQKWKNRFFERLAVKAVQAFIAPTDFAGKLSAELLKVPTKKIHTIHYGLQLENFVNLQPEIFEAGKILYIGTLIRKKGVFELPQIFEKVCQEIPTAKLYLIGHDSPDISTGKPSTWSLLRQAFKPATLQRVSYLGKIPYNEVVQEIVSAHVCVFPTYAETLGMVTIESMALQKAVVNSNIGWAQELIDDEVNGLLAHPSDHDKFAHHLIKILQQPRLANQLGKAARKKVEKEFDMKKIAKQNIAFYQSLLP